MKIFTINKGATLPYLEMEPIVDGRHDFGKLYLAMQSATVRFSMTNVENNVKKIANAEAYVVPFDNGGCSDKIKIQYRWKKRDTAESGRYKALFTIEFDPNITMEGVTFPSGKLIVPIHEDLIICIND